MARRPFALAMLLALLLSPPLQAEPGEGEETARERLDAIGEEIQALSSRLVTTRETRDEADMALREVETSLAETHRRLDTLQAERRSLGDEIAALEAARQGLETERDDQLNGLGLQLDALYRLGLTPQLKLLLNQDDPARLDRLQHYLNHLARARNIRLDEIARLDRALADNRRELEVRSEHLDALAEELSAKSAELSEQMAERATIVGELDSRYTSEQARMEALTQDRAEAEEVLSRIQEEVARLQRPPPSTAIARTQGELPWPVQGAIASGYRRGNGVHQNGILIHAAEGSRVQAVHAGQVVFADWMRGFGNLLIIDHGDQVMTLHAHLQHFEAQVGQAVSRGDTLGAVGESGGQPRAALYFEVRRGGDPIDPQSWIAAR